MKSIFAILILLCCNLAMAAKTLSSVSFCVVPDSSGVAFGGISVNEIVGSTDDPGLQMVVMYNPNPLDASFQSAMVAYYSKLVSQIKSAQKIP